MVCGESQRTLRWCGRHKGYRWEFKVICRRTTSMLGCFISWWGQPSHFTVGAARFCGMRNIVIHEVFSGEFIHCLANNSRRSCLIRSLSSPINKSLRMCGSRSNGSITAPMHPTVERLLVRVKGYLRRVNEVVIPLSSSPAWHWVEKIGTQVCGDSSIKVFDHPKLSMCRWQ